MKKINPKQIVNNVEKAKFKYNKVTGTFRNELGQEKSMVEANKSNEIEAQKSRRKAFYSRAWVLS